MRRARATFVAVLGGLLAACVPNPSGEAAPSGAPGPVWKATSARFELTSFGFWDGSSAYGKDVADISAQQLNALAGLRTLPTPTGTRGSDYVSFRFRVLDQDGSSVTYRAAQDNIVDFDEGGSATARPTIDFATLQPLLDTIHCLSAKGSTPKERTTDTPPSPTAEDMTTAVSLPTDLGCNNGVFVPYGCSDTFFTLDVPAPTTYRISGTPCLEMLKLRAYTSDGATLLAESEPSASPRKCISLESAFDVGRYVLVLSKTNAAGCSAPGAAGDTSLQLERVQ